MLDAFKLLDRDNSGFLDAEELRDAMILMKSPISLEEAMQMVRLLDINGDNKVDYNELMRMMFITSPTLNTSAALDPDAGKPVYVHPALKAMNI